MFCCSLIYRVKQFKCHQVTQNTFQRLDTLRQISKKKISSSFPGLRVYSLLSFFL